MKNNDITTQKPGETPAFVKSGKKRLKGTCSAGIARFRRALGRFDRVTEENPYIAGTFFLMQAIPAMLLYFLFGGESATFFGVDISGIKSHRTLVLILLLIAPVMTGAKKILKRLGFQDEREKAVLLNKLAETQRTGSNEVSQHLQASGMTVEALERLVLQSVAKSISLAFGAIAGAKQESIKVIVGTVIDGMLIDISVRAPAGVTSVSHLRDLQHPSTTFSHCIKNKEMVVIEDVEHEAHKKDSRFYVTPTHPNRAKGSLICFPIVDINNVVQFAISIHCDEPLRYWNQDRKFYVRTIEPYTALITSVRSQIYKK